MVFCLNSACLRQAFIILFEFEGSMASSACEVSCSQSQVLQSICIVMYCRLVPEHTLEPLTEIVCRVLVFEHAAVTWMQCSSCLCMLTD